MSRFANLKTVPTPVASITAAAPGAAEDAGEKPAGKAKARAGKVQVAGFFSEDLRRTLHQMVLDERKGSLQELLGEAIDLLLRSRGKNAFGER